MKRGIIDRQAGPFYHLRDFMQAPLRRCHVYRTKIYLFMTSMVNSLNNIRQTPFLWAISENSSEDRRCCFWRAPGTNVRFVNQLMIPEGQWR
jgi:hypothetical protein